MESESDSDPSSVRFANEIQEIKNNNPSSIHFTFPDYHRNNTHHALEIAAALYTITELKTLSLPCRGLDDNVVSHIAKALHVNRTLLSLKICSSDITSISIWEIAMMLQENKALTCLAIAGKLVFSGIYLLSVAMKTNISLLELSLDFYYNDYCSDAENTLEYYYDRHKRDANKTKSAEAISEMLAINMTLTKLCLTNFSVPSDGIKLIADSLHSNISLRSLVLSGCNFDSEGAQSIATMIRINKSLKDLYIFDCRISSTGMKDIVIALQHNETLNRLTLKKDSESTLEEEEKKEVNEVMLDTIYNWNDTIYDVDGICPSYYMMNSKLSRLLYKNKLKTRIAPKKALRKRGNILNWLLNKWICLKRGNKTRKLLSLKMP
jgi:hypothetical protein